MLVRNFFQFFATYREFSLIFSSCHSLIMNALSQNHQISMIRGTFLWTEREGCYGRYFITPGCWIAFVQDCVDATVRLVHDLHKNPAYKFHAEKGDWLNILEMFEYYPEPYKRLMEELIDLDSTEGFYVCPLCRCNHVLDF